MMLGGRCEKDAAKERSIENYEWEGNEQVGTWKWINSTWYYSFVWRRQERKKLQHFPEGGTEWGQDDEAWRHHHLQQMVIGFHRPSMGNHPRNTLLTIQYGKMMMTWRRETSGGEFFPWQNETSSQAAYIGSWEGDDDSEISFTKAKSELRFQLHVKRERSPLSESGSNSVWKGGRTRFFQHLTHSKCLSHTLVHSYSIHFYTNPISCTTSLLLISNLCILSIHSR